MYVYTHIFIHTDTYIQPFTQMYGKIHIQQLFVCHFTIFGALPYLLFCLYNRSILVSSLNVSVNSRLVQASKLI